MRGGALSFTQCLHPMRLPPPLPIRSFSHLSSAGAGSASRRPRRKPPPKGITLYSDQCFTAATSTQHHNRAQGPQWWLTTLQSSER